MMNRRSFLAAAASAAARPTVGSAAIQGSPAAKSPLCFFSKPFNSLSFEELAQKTAALGFSGIEAPIRRGGHIEPEAVPDELPQLVEALRRHDCRIHIMTSDVNDPRAPLTETVLKTAAKLGIRHYRMKYFRYAEGVSVTKQVDEWTAQLKDLAAMNRELGITALYQNHAGPHYFGAAVWDLHRAIQDIDPTEVGMAYDIRHATAEAGMSWRVGYRLMQPHIKALYLKDFEWGEKKAVNVPLGEGRIDKNFMRLVAASDFSGPVSLHEEYLSHRDPQLVPQHWEAIEKDFATLRSWMKV